MRKCYKNISRMSRRLQPEQLSQTAQFYLLHGDDVTRHYLLVRLSHDQCSCNPDFREFLKNCQEKIISLADSPMLNHRPHYNEGRRCRWIATSPETSLVISLIHKKHVILNFSGFALQSKISRFRCADEAVTDPLYTLTKAFLIVGGDW